MTLIGKSNSVPENSYEMTELSQTTRLLHQEETQSAQATQNNPVDSFQGPTPVSSKKPSRIPEKIKEVALSVLTQKLSPGVSIDLPAGFVLAIKAFEQPFTVDSERIKSDEIKAAYSKAKLLERGVRNVVWFETGGILELGLGLNGTVPLGLFAGIDGGFKVSGLISYRQMQPVTIGHFNFTSSVLKAFCPKVPFSADSASSMPPGSEFAITGQGTISLSAKLTVNAGAKICNVVSRIAQASAGLSSARQKTYELKIYSLNGKDKVRVTLAERTSTKFALLANITAGADVTIPGILPGDGFLKSALENPTKSVAKSFYEQYTRATLDAEISTTHTDLELCTFDMDLNKLHARKAYEQMLKLRPTDAVALSFAKDSGVKMVKVIEHDDTDAESIGINLFGAKLLMVRALEMEKSGVASRAGGPKIYYHETKFNKEFSWWFSGQKNITWETISVLPEEETRPSHYFHLAYKQKNYVTKQKEVDRFFTFADLMGVHRAKDIHKSLPHLNKIAQIFTSANDTQSKVDIYVTEKGLNAIKEAGYREAFHAFSRAHGILKPNYRSLPWLAKKSKETDEATLLLVSTLKKQRLSWVSWIPYVNPVDQAAETYFALTQRNLKKDIAFFEKAALFGRMIELFGKTSSTKSLETWFTALGKQTGFAFMTTVAALQQLTSQEEILVHELNIQGGGICLQSIDEGKLKAPSSFATDLLIA